MDFHELNGMTVAELREVAKGVEGLTGYTQMHKARLLQAICQQLNIEMHEHHDVVGIDKGELKQRIQVLKRDRDAALESHDHAALRQVRRKIHRLKRQIRRATV